MVNYEWDIETVEVVTAENVQAYNQYAPETKIGELGDIQDHNHADKLSDFRQSEFEAEAGQVTRLVLVRDGSVRSWACVFDGKLPIYFQDAYGENTTKVPQRFHKELARFFSSWC